MMITIFDPMFQLFNAYNPFIRTIHNFFHAISRNFVPKGRNPLVKTGGRVGHKRAANLHTVHRDPNISFHQCEVEHHHRPIRQCYRRLKSVRNLRKKHDRNIKLRVRLNSCLYSEKERKKKKEMKIRYM